MIRLHSRDGSYYHLRDTEKKKTIGQCKVNLGRYKNMDCIEIWCVSINQPYLRQGYGTLMLQRIIKKYSKYPCPIMLYVYKDNEPAISLYKKLGFEIIGEYKYGYKGAWAMQYKVN